MRPDPESTRKILLNAREAMQHGDRQAARTWAEQAVALDPESEEPWLFLAALSSPRASVKYLEHALKINPASVRARKGMHWAVERLRREPASRSENNQSRSQRKPGVKTISEDTMGFETGKSAAVEPKTQPRAQKLPKQTISASAASADLPLPKAIAGYRWSILTIFLIAICGVAAWVFWPGNASSALAFLNTPPTAPAIPGIFADIIKPTYTSSPTATSTPTANSRLQHRPLRSHRPPLIPRRLPRHPHHLKHPCQPTQHDPGRPTLPYQQ